MTGTFRTRRARSSRPALAMLVLSLVSGVAFAGCRRGGSGPTQSDVLPAAYLVYPGASESRRSWRPEERGRSVEGQDLSAVAELHLVYALESAAPGARIQQWYDERLLSDGWAPDETTPIVSSYTKRVGARTHVLRVEIADQPITGRYDVRYRIGFAGSSAR